MEEESRESRVDLDSMASQGHRFFRCLEGKKSSRRGGEFTDVGSGGGVLAGRRSGLFGELATFAQREKGD